MAEAVQDFHPLPDEQVLVLPLPLHRVPLFTQVLTAPFQVEFQEECPVVLSGEGRQGRGREKTGRQGRGREKTGWGGRKMKLAESHQIIGFVTMVTFYTHVVKQ